MSPRSGGSAKRHESGKVVTVYNIKRQKEKRGRTSVLDVIESLRACVVWVGLNRVVE